MRSGQRAAGGGRRQRRWRTWGAQEEGFGLEDACRGNLRLLEWREYGSEIDDKEIVDRGETRRDQTLWDVDRRARVTVETVILPR